MWALHTIVVHQSTVRQGVEFFLPVERPLTLNRVRARRFLEAHHPTCVMREQRNEANEWVLKPGWEWDFELDKYVRVRRFLSAHDAGIDRTLVSLTDKHETSLDGNSSGSAVSDHFSIKRARTSFGCKYPAYRS
jgi:hypothetical protein